MKKVLNIAFLLGFSVAVQAQRPLKTIHEGNQLYQQKKYDEAGISYLKAAGMDSTNVRALYNATNSLYKMGEYETAMQGYDHLLSDETLNKKLSKSQKADIYHNLGNACLKKEEYEKGVNAYKEALKLKPNDEKTKYNLTYALRKMQQQNQQNQNQQNDKNNQDKQQQKQQQQQQNQENKNNQNQQQQQQQREQNPQQKPEQNQGQQPDKMKKSDAERMLNAMDNQEKNTLDKRKKIKVSQGVKTDKDW